MDKIHAGIVELAVVELFDYRKHFICPNIHWGWDLRHEADLIVVDKNLRATEVEIKVTLQDLKADFKKAHGHSSKKIGRMYYAIPQYLVEKGFDLIPSKYGVIVIDEVKKYAGDGKTFLYKIYEAKFLRQCRHDKEYMGITPDQLTRLLALGCMRIWTLKSHNHRKYHKTTF